MASSGWEQLKQKTYKCADFSFNPVVWCTRRFCQWASNILKWYCWLHFLLLQMHERAVSPQPHKHWWNMHIHAWARLGIHDAVSRFSVFFPINTDSCDGNDPHFPPVSWLNTLKSLIFVVSLKWSTRWRWDIRGSVGPRNSHHSGQYTHIGEFYSKCAAQKELPSRRLKKKDGVS